MSSSVSPLWQDSVATIVRLRLPELRAELGADFACLWMLDEKENPLERFADPAIDPGVGVALSQADLAEHLSATGAPVTPYGVRLRKDGWAIAFLELHGVNELPLSLPEGIADELLPLAEALDAARGLNAAEMPARGNILIIEDDEEARTLLRTILSRERFEVTEAANGAEGLATANEHPPDLIILDWQMPVMDGLQATILLKTNPATLGVPILMLTSRLGFEPRVQALDAGVQDFLNKPFDRSELIARVEQQLRWRRLFSETGKKRKARKRTKADPSLNPEAAVEEALSQARSFEEIDHFEAAAAEYRVAAEIASKYINPDVGNKFLRLAGKAYLQWAESDTNGTTVQEAYVLAARAFLGAGNLDLAKRSSDRAGIPIT